MKALAVPIVDTATEAKRIGFALLVSTSLVLALFFSGFRTPASVLAALGFAVVLERLHRLFHHFRRQRNFAAVLGVVAFGMLVLAAVGVVMLAAAPTHPRGGS
jgi:predicted PurR-regulated permease PerM